MRFPLALTVKIAAYIIGKKLKANRKFATVCNSNRSTRAISLARSCGRIREYFDLAKKKRHAARRLSRSGGRM